MLLVFLVSYICSNLTIQEFIYGLYDYEKITELNSYNKTHDKKMLNLINYVKSLISINS